MSWLATGRWPAPCAICREWTRGGLCNLCLQRFAAPHSRCTGCGLALASDALTAASAQAPRCGRCIEDPPPVTGTLAALDYGFPWDGLIGAMKFGGRPEMAKLLVKPLLQAIRQDKQHSAEAVELLLPVPLFEKRAQQRGYNQSWELARRLGKALDRPAHADWLLRWRATETQSLLADPTARSANLRGAFMLSTTGSRALAGRRVALVDDVMTTGATAFEAARTLRQAGAAEVWLWVLARTPTAAPKD
ncbi:MAG TPA: ComF family protein [Ideonella sp.]|uniref:ComF family protein n=1 Tax=Ideonella sp. TaxID=1929293 RepID=UPI002C0EE0E7|nr:ComF family protein [Ideonella sp.]HSI48367.1 ComF family protein [Ideonella sp.]